VRVLIIADQKDLSFIQQEGRGKRKMNKKNLLAMASGLSALALVATCGPALASGHFGHRGHHGGDMQFRLLAHAAGITGEQIHAAFAAKASTLKSDFEAVKSTKKAADACIIAGNASCSTQISAYATAQSTLAQDKLSVWQGLFAANGTTKDAAAVSLKSNLDDLNAKKRQLLHSVFSSAEDTSVTEKPAQE
jgi:hypothetical protein